MRIDPAELSQAERYKLLIGGIVPRPIAVVSTVSVEGVFNVAPFSFFNGVGSDPMTLLFCPANTADGGEKDSLRNAKPAAEGGTGVFVVNVASEEILRQVAAGELSPEEAETAHHTAGVGNGAAGSQAGGGAASGGTPSSSTSGDGAGSATASPGSYANGAGAPVGGNF